MRALTGLKQAGAALAINEGTGRLPEMSLGKIHVDPNNARRSDDENSAEGLAEQAELTQDIRKRGVKSPVSLRPHPTVIGEYMLNYGHRRLKGAIQAGLSAIPYFLDTNFDNYDQVKENLLHRKPSIWALTEFVQRRLDEGQSKGEIAEGLGKANQNLVTELLALVDAPICMHQAYGAGVASPRTLYDLRRAYDEFPELVEAWCFANPKITRESIQEFVLDCRRGVNEKSGTTGEDSPLVRGEPMPDAGATAPEFTPVVMDGKVSKMPDPKSPIDPDSPRHQNQHRPLESELRHDVKAKMPPSTEKAPSAPAKAAPGMKQIMVEYQGKRACIARDATVTILVEGCNDPLQVRVTELTFTSSR